MARRSTLPRFLLLYAALFATCGVASPFLPAILKQDGLLPWHLGMILAAGAGSASSIVATLISGQLDGRIGLASSSG